jgi:hypothetical protein
MTGVNILTVVSSLQYSLPVRWVIARRRGSAGCIDMDWSWGESGANVTCEPSTFGPSVSGADTELLPHPVRPTRAEMLIARRII